MSDLRIKELEKENTQLKKEIEELKAILNTIVQIAAFLHLLIDLKKKDKNKRSLRQNSNKPSGGQAGHKRVRMI